MATYDATLYPEAFQNMEDRRKTVYTLIGTDEYACMVSGDRLEFGSYGSITIGMVRRYSSLDELVATEGWQSLVPEAESAEDAIARVRGIPEWDPTEESRCGVLSLRVRDARRKERD